MLNSNLRFNSQNNLINAKSQEILANLKILCIGAGGLGVIVSTYLVSSGGLNLTIIDNDTIEINNLNRQITYTENDCGKYKASTLKEYLNKINSTAKINAINEFLTEDNANYLVSKHDLIIDCTDNYSARYLINDIAKEYHKNLVCGSVDGFKGAIMVFLQDSCYRCIFPNNQANSSCTMGNILPATVAAVASLMVNEIIKLICRYSIKSKIISIDTLNNKMSEHNILTDFTCINEHSTIKDSFIAQYISIQNIKEIDDLKIIYLDKNLNLSKHPTLNKFEAFFINDILEYYNFQSSRYKLNSQTHVEILNPLINLDTKILVICHHGIRSQIVASNLISLGYINVYYSIINK